MGAPGLGGESVEKPQKKILKRRLLLVILLIVTLLFLPGCGGKREVEELIFVMGIGIDLGKKEGTYLVTMQMAEPTIGGGGAAELKNTTISVETPSLSFVTEKINEAFDKQPFPGTAKIIVIGEELARSGINEVLDYLQRFYQYRRTAYLLIARGEAKDILETKVRNEDIPALGLLGTIEGQNHLTVFPVTRLGHYLTVLSREGQKPIIPTVEEVEPGKHGFYYSDEEGKELLVHQAGIFEEGIMVAILTDQESKGYLWLNNEINSRFINAKGEGELLLSAWIVDGKTKFKVEEIDGKMGIKFIINARLAIREILGQHKEMEAEEWHNFLKENEPLFSKVIQEECEVAIAKAKNTQLDFIGIGRKIEIKNPKYWRQIRENWKEEIVNFPVAYDVKVKIEHSGLARNSPVSIQEK